MVFLSLVLPPLGFLLYLLLVHPSLHCILKLAIHVFRFLDHWHFLGIYVVRFLSMHIVPNGLSLTYILLNVIHALFDYDLLIRLATDYC